MTRPIGIEFISVFAMPPVEFVRLAADLGCGHVGLGLAPITGNPLDYPAWSLRDDAALRRETIAAMRDSGVAVSVGEGFLVLPGRDVADAARDIDLLAELGAPVLNIVPLDPDTPRCLDQLGQFAEMAVARGMRSTLEFLPGMPMGSLPAALEAVRHVARADFTVLIDAMHLFRSGATVADVAAAPAGAIGYFQLCDVPLVAGDQSYADEARFDRRCPGKGELPLGELLAALPPDLLVGLEVPMLAAAQARGGPLEPLAECIAATRALLAGR